MSFADYPTVDLTAYLKEYETDTPIPVGALVEYHGSISYCHGAYEVIDNPGYTPGSLALAPIDPNLPGQNLYNVRPKSVTVVALP